MNQGQHYLGVMLDAAKFPLAVHFVKFSSNFGAKFCTRDHKMNSKWHFGGISLAYLSITLFLYVL
jgi:hypothetical protein